MTNTTTWSTMMLMSLLATSATATAQFGVPRSNEQQPRTAERLTKVELVLDSDRAVMPGETIHLAVIFSIEPGWHLYWKNPGEGAPPPNVNVELPEGFEVGETRWPRPITIPSPVGDMYCYEGEFALFIPVTAPDNLDDGEATLTVNANWAVCDKDLCLFGDTTREMSLQTTSSTVRTLEARPIPPKIAKHRPRLPQKLSDGSVQLRGQALHVQVPANDHDDATFYPHDSAGVTYSEPTITRDGDHFAIVIEMETNPNNFLDGPPDVGGLIALGTEPDDPSYEFSLPLQ